MQLTENRKLAWIVFALCAVVAITFGGGRSLNGLRNETLKLFTDGEGADGAGVNRDLNQRADKAQMMASIALKYLPADDAGAVEVQKASETLRQSENLADRQRANALLNTAIETLYSRLDVLNASENDQRDLRTAYRDFKGHGDMISRDPFNEKARDFNKVRSGFPAGLIAGLSGVHELPAFE